MFDTFVGMCAVDYVKMPRASYVLTSDDVFDYALKARSINEGIDDQSNELFDKYVAVHRQMAYDPEIGQMHGLDDYERWREVREIISPKKSQSSYIKKRVVNDIDLCSNGETAMRYFLDRIDEDAVYILDEPTTGLDPQTRTTLWAVIEKMRKEEGMTVLLTTHYMEEAADADYVVIIDSGRISAEGTPHDLKEKYAGDYITLYGVEESAVKSLELPYCAVSGGYRINVPSTKVATKLITEHAELFNDYEIVKGKMDAVFLSVTGKKLSGDK